MKGSDCSVGGYVFLLVLELGDHSIICSLRCWIDGLVRIIQLLDLGLVAVSHDAIIDCSGPRWEVREFWLSIFLLISNDR